jgi:hypothetical protein
MLVITTDNGPSFIRAARHSFRPVVIIEPVPDAPGGVLTDEAVERLAAAAASARGGRWWVLFRDAEKLARPSSILSANVLMRLAEARASLKTRRGENVGLDSAVILVIHHGAISGAPELSPLERLRLGWGKVYSERGGPAAGSERRLMNIDALFGRIGGLIDASRSGSSADWSAAADSLDCRVSHFVSHFAQTPRYTTYVVALFPLCALFFYLFCVPTRRRKAASDDVKKSKTVENLATPSTSAGAQSGNALKTSPAVEDAPPVPSSKGGPRRSKSAKKNR